MRVLGIFFSILLMIGGMALGGSPVKFIDLPSLIIVIGCAQGVLFAMYGADSLRIFLPSFAPNNPELGVRIAAAGSHLYIMAGWIGTGIGWIHMGFGIDMAKPETFGPAFAVSLLTPLYGYCAHFLVWFPLKAKWVAKQKSA